MTLRRVLISSVSLATVLVVTVHGQELSFTASVDRTRVGIDDHVTLTVSVSGSDVGGISEPDLPSLDKFDIVGTNSSTSSQFTLVNGKMSSSKTIDYIYYLRPKETGKVTIGPARLQFKGKTYRTEPITVEVLAGSIPGGKRSSSSTRKARQQTPKDVDVEGNLFLSAHYNKEEVYVGQPVTVTYGLYSRVRLSNVQYGEIPSYSGFWVEDIYQADRLNFETKVMEGKRYDVAMIKKVALFPTTSGKLTIEPMELICEVSVRSRDMFFDFWGKRKRVRIKSQPAEISVLALPDSKEGRPTGFSGAVGTFSLRAQVEHRRVKAGEPINLEVAIEGTGNLRIIPEPTIADVEGLKWYEPEVTDNISSKGGKIRGSKTYRYVIIPQMEGSYTIGPIELPYFDPEKEHYMVARSEPMAITVLPGEKMVETFVSREGIKLMGRDIRYIKSDVNRLPNQGGYLYQNRIFQAVQLFPLLIIVLSTFYRRHRDRVSRDVRYARLRRARKLARRRLNEARCLMRTGSSTEFYAAVWKSMAGYLGDKLNLAASGLTNEQISQKLRENGLEEETIDKILDCFQACDYARFAPSTATEEEMEKTLIAAKEAIASLEKRSSRIIMGG